MGLPERPKSVARSTLGARPPRSGASSSTGLPSASRYIVFVAAFGKAFNDNRIIAIVWIILPVIGLLERYGLQARARDLIAGFKNATVSKLLILYLLYRQLTAAIGPDASSEHRLRER